MKSVLVKLYHSSHTVFQSLISIICVVLFSSHNANKQIKACIHDDKKNTECIIIGNGPSINNYLENSIDDISNKDTFVVNYFALTDFFKLVKPNFYLMMDKDIYTLNPTPFNNENKNNLELISILNKISWNMTIFAPNKFKNTPLIKAIFNKNVKIVYFNSTPINGIKFIENFFFKKNLGMPKPETVIIPAIFLAINLKYSCINLFGAEASWLKYLHVTDNNEVIVRLKHFYKNDSDSIQGHSTLSTLSTFLITQAHCFSSHMRLQEYSKYRSSQILNYTPESYIDAYKKVKSNKLMN